MDVNNNEALIKKETLYAGSKFIPLKSGAKVKFHYETKRADNEKVIDCSRKINKPMEMVLGRKFKLEVWEVIVQKMSLNEVAKFTVDKSVRINKSDCMQIPQNIKIFLAGPTISICFKNN